MKLIDINTTTEISLPDDLLWVDEFNWAAPVASSQHSLSGALVIQSGVRLAGRPITLQPPAEGYGWVRRSVVNTLRTWINSNPSRLMSLIFEYAEDTRSFTVVFRYQDTALEAEPVLGTPDRHSDDQWYRVTLRLMEV